MAWAILRNQSSTLIERQERALEFEQEEHWDFEGGWEADFADEDYNFSLGVMTGAADDVLPSIFEGRIHRDEGRPVTLGELLLGLQDAGRLAEEQRTRERIAKERRDANEKARARFKGSLHVEDLEGDLKRTWTSLKTRASDDGSASLAEVANDLNNASISQGIEEDEARAEAQVTAFVSTLFLTNRGYVDLSQEGGEKGDIVLRDLWVDSPDYDELTEKLHPKSEIGRVTNV